MSKRFTCDECGLDGEVCSLIAMLRSWAEEGDKQKTNKKEKELRGAIADLINQKEKELLDRIGFLLVDEENVHIHHYGETTCDICEKDKIENNLRGSLRDRVQQLKEESQGCRCPYMHRELPKHYPWCKEAEA